jgi:hypothetical protein
MKISKYPWTLCTYHNTRLQPQFFVVMSEDRKTIAEVFFHQDKTPDGQSEELANALMITASPEMYEALELVKNYLLLKDPTASCLGLIAYVLNKAEGKITVDKAGYT